MSWKRLLLFAALASLIASALLAIAILLFGEFDDTQARILATTFSISLASLLGLPGALLGDRGRAQPLALANVSAAIVAFLLAVAAIWAGDDNEALWRLVGTAAVIALALAQVAGTTIRRRHDDSAGVTRAYWAAVAAIVLAAVLAIFAIWNEPDSESFYRSLAALAVLDVLLVVLQPILRRLGGGSADDAVTLVLEGSREQIDEAVRRVEGTGVRVRR